jgi:hypothetical protein
MEVNKYTYHNICSRPEESEEYLGEKYKRLGIKPRSPESETRNESWT